MERRNFREKRANLGKGCEAPVFSVPSALRRAVAFAVGVFWHDGWAYGAMGRTRDGSPTRRFPSRFGTDGRPPTLNSHPQILLQSH